MPRGPSGPRKSRSKPRVEDLAAFISGWGVNDPECAKFLTGIGMKSGALGQIDKTVKLASMLAMGSNQPLNISHLKAAWQNRDVEDMA